VWKPATATRIKFYRHTHEIQWWFLRVFGLATGKENYIFQVKSAVKSHVQTLDLYGRVTREFTSCLPRAFR